MSVRVRFAPAPTGLLHVGNARTALFNWLFARHHRGTFILRVEDTDQKRYSDAALQSIFESLRWLGVDWDEGPDAGGPHAPYNQMGRLDRYRAAADRLLADGKLYRCFCTPEQLDAMRKQAQAEKRKPMYDGRCSKILPGEADARALDGEPCVLRVRVPEGQLTFDDAIRGPITFDLKEIDDFICVRSNGTPVYQFTVAVDDADMEITHVLRGEDHISNTPKQMLLLRMLGHAPPTYAHLPLLHGAGGGKLSKRDGAQTITDLRDLGYTREAVVNFLAMLGWSAKSEDEIFDTDELIERFDLDGCGKAAAVFSLKKLDWFNGQWIRKWPLEQFRDAIGAQLQSAGLIDDAFIAEKGDWLTHFARVTQERVAKLPEIVEYARCFFIESAKDIEYEEKGYRKYFGKEDALDNLKISMDVLQSTAEADFVGAPLGDAYQERADALHIKLAALVHPTRLAVTGSTVGAPLFDTLELIGKDECLARLEQAIIRVTTAQSA